MPINAIHYIKDSTQVTKKIAKRVLRNLQIPIIEEENVEKEWRIMSLAKSMWDVVRESERAKGIKKGREEGRKKSMEKVALEMLKNNTDIRFICQCTGLAKEQVLKLKNDLK